MRCYQCFRPQAQCLCRLIEPIEHETEVLILQHPKERGHAFNTVRIAQQSLRRAEVIVGRGEELGSNRELAKRLASGGFGVLYPSDKARDLSTLPPHARPRGLAVVDGTWDQARTMVRDIEVLHHLPHFTLPAGLTSGFRIRRQPGVQCLSTLEALRVALGHLEPGLPNLDALIAPFHAMQEQHLAVQRAPVPRQNLRRKARGSGLHRVFSDRFESLVVAYGELGCVEESSQGNRPLLTFAAERIATGQRLSRVLSEVRCSDTVRRHMRLGPKDIEEAVPLPQLRRQWAEFIQPGDYLATWSKTTMDAARRDLGDDLAEPLMLKVHYFNQRRHRGALDEIVRAERLATDAEAQRWALGMSRTEERLQYAGLVANLMRRLAHSEKAI